MQNPMVTLDTTDNNTKSNGNARYRRQQYKIPVTLGTAGNNTKSNGNARYHRQQYKISLLCPQCPNILRLIRKKQLLFLEYNFHVVFFMEKRVFCDVTTKFIHRHIV
jgi:hypothetical protein